jgi:hypothetical protein
MRRTIGGTATGVYLVIPAIVCVLAPIAYGQPVTVNRDVLVSLALNYLFFATPHFAWAVLHKFMGVRRHVAHSGYVGANVALISLHLILGGASHPEDGLILYWPWAALGIACGCTSATIYNRLREQPAT